MCLVLAPQENGCYTKKEKKTKQNQMAFFFSSLLMSFFSGLIKMRREGEAKPGPGPGQRAGKATK